MGNGAHTCPGPQKPQIPGTGIHPHSGSTLPKFLHSPKLQSAFVANHSFMGEIINVYGRVKGKKQPKSQRRFLILAPDQIGTQTPASLLRAHLDF